MPATVLSLNQMDRKLLRDLRTLVLFIEFYCRDCHGRHPGRAAVNLKSHDLEGLVGRAVHLCPDCAKLLQHAMVKRTHCPMDPKPVCKHCPRHCYAPAYRQTIRQVMRHSGRAMVLRGRIDYLWHLLF